MQAGVGPAPYPLFSLVVLFWDFSTTAVHNSLFIRFEPGV